MIVLATDFGLEGPYVGQMQAVLAREAPGVPVVSLFADLPAFDAYRAAYLLAAYVESFPPGCVFVGVVDPGVGGERAAVALRADARWFVGPDNGLFNVIARRARRLEWWDVTWRPERLSASFHGRDLFAPVAARIARGESMPGNRTDVAGRVDESWPEDLLEVVYIDRYGNALTGLRAEGLAISTRFGANGRTLEHRRTFVEAAPGAAFWYENSNGLVEFAVNGGSAAQVLGLAVGTAFEIERN